MSTPTRTRPSSAPDHPPGAVMRRRLTATVGIIAVMIVWGSTYVVTKAAVEDGAGSRRRRTGRFPAPAAGRAPGDARAHGAHRDRGPHRRLQLRADLRPGLARRADLRPRISSTISPCASSTRVSSAHWSISTRSSVWARPTCFSARSCRAGSSRGRRRDRWHVARVIRPADSAYSLRDQLLSGTDPGGSRPAQARLRAKERRHGCRASLYILSLSSSLVALGFASRSPEVFVPFIAIVLPALFLLGVFTAVRLVDSRLEAWSS